MGTVSPTDDLNAWVAAVGGGRLGRQVRPGCGGMRLGDPGPPPAATSGAKALKDTALIINELRAHAGLDPWHPKRPEPRA